MKVHALIALSMLALTACLVGCAVRPPVPDELLGEYVIPFVKADDSIELTTVEIHAGDPPGRMLFCIESHDGDTLCVEDDGAGHALRSRQPDTEGESEPLQGGT
jgi:hypothetical protein